VASGPDQLAWTPVNRAAEPAKPLPPGGLAPVAQAPAAKDASASDHEAVGDDAVRGGDWSTAAVAFRKAVALDPRNARLQFKMGEALLKSGDAVGAMAPLLDAASRGQMRAWRLLGDAARSQGDVAGANAHYQKYLATQPSDAAEVRALLGGGG
jgi:predicted Zn-dependent protease